MKQKAFLSFIIFGIILISGCTQDENIKTISTTPTVKTAIQIYNINQTINSDNKAQILFYENFNTIINATKQIVMTENSPFSGIKASCIENNEILLDKIYFEKRTFQKGDDRFGSFWFGDFNKEQYTFKINFKHNTYNLKYLMDSEGIIYLAGEYCPII